MTKVNLNNEPNEIITGNDNIVIAKYLDGIDGGRSLDVTGYPLKVIKAGVPAITDGAGTYKPMPLNAENARRSQQKRTVVQDCAFELRPARLLPLAGFLWGFHTAD